MATPPFLLQCKRILLKIPRPKTQSRSLKIERYFLGLGKLYGFLTCISNKDKWATTLSSTFNLRGSLSKLNFLSQHRIYWYTHITAPAVPSKLGWIPRHCWKNGVKPPLFLLFLLCCRLPPKLGETAKVYRIDKTFSSKSFHSVLRKVENMPLPTHSNGLSLMIKTYFLSTVTIYIQFHQPIFWDKNAHLHK